MKLNGFSKWIRKVEGRPVYKPFRISSRTDTAFLKTGDMVVSLEDCGNFSKGDLVEVFCHYGLVCAVSSKKRNTLCTLSSNLWRFADES